MKRLFVIQCRFQVEEHGNSVNGLAICFNPDTPHAFIYPDGSMYSGETIWNYTLNHYSPWAAFDIA